jgi:hypothetical protein
MILSTIYTIQDGDDEVIYLTITAEPGYGKGISQKETVTFD